MKVIIDHYGTPFYLAHGGMQIQIQETKKALERIGVEVELARWWDETQSGDIIHSFGRRRPSFIEFAKARGMKFVMAELQTGLGSRSRLQLLGQRWIKRSAERFLPAFAIAAFKWESFRMADACVALTEWEAYLINYVHGINADKIHVIPNGVEDIFLTKPVTPPVRGRWLLFVGTIVERKRVLETALAAVKAKVPLCIVGAPYDGISEYYSNELKMLVDANPQFLRYAGNINHQELASMYREARGFVLLSAKESQSLAALEAAASGCPLLLSDLPWARRTFKERAHYAPITSNIRKTATVLSAFYEDCDRPIVSYQPKSWLDVAETLHTLYKKILF